MVETPQATPKSAVLSFQEKKVLDETPYCLTPQHALLRPAKRGISRTVLKSPQSLSIQVPLWPSWRPFESSRRMYELEETCNLLPVFHFTRNQSLQRTRGHFASWSSR